MNAVRVKICGITRAEDALAAVRFGADAIGFNFFPGSKRYCPPPQARRILSALPPFVTSVGVFVNARSEELAAAVRESGISVAQLHGDERPEDCAAAGVPVIKALRVDGPEAVARARDFEVSAVLLDAPSSSFGGSGARFDWSLARELAARRSVILAGGLTPENVGDAIRAVRPYAVDVASGVEDAPGIKSAERMRRFIQAAKEVAS